MSDDTHHLAFSREQITVIVNPRKIGMYLTTDDELDRLAEGFAALSSTFFGVCAGAAGAVGLTLLTVPVDGAKAFAALVASMIVSSLGTLYFGWRLLVERKRARATVEGIKRRELPTPPTA